MPTHVGIARSLVVTVALVAITNPVRGSAQSVRGLITDEQNGQPLVGAWLEALDSVGTRVGVAVTDGAGRYELRAGGAASLIASFIGYETAELALGRSNPSDTLFIDVSLSVRPVELRGIEIDGERRCYGERFRAVGSARVWDEARRALELARWTEDHRAIRYDLEMFQRRLDESGRRVISESKSPRSALGRHPFESLPASELADHGYVRESDGSFTYHAPDVEALLSDPFLETHCFSVVVGDGEHEGDIGLHFEPTPDRAVPEIMGTFWLDGATSRLKLLEFRYTGLDRDIDTSGIGGRVSFAGVDDGGWIVDEWSIRTPVVGLERVAGSTMSRSMVIGIQESGGAVVRVRRRGEVLTARLPATEIRGRVLEEVTDRPLEGATVRLAGTAYLARTADDGSFAIRGMRGGTYQLKVHHPSLDDLGQDTIRVVADTQDDADGVEVHLPTRASLLTSSCIAQGQPPEERSAIIAGRVIDVASGVPVPDAMVRASSFRVDRVDETGFDGGTTWSEVRASADGRFLHCSVPAPETVRLSAQALGVESDELTLEVDPGAVYDTIVPLSLGTAATVMGVVHASDTGEPVPGAEVVVGHASGLTNEDGRFSISGVTAGLRQLRVTHLAFGERTDSILVGGSNRVFLDISLQPTAIELGGLVVEVSSGRLAEYRARGTRVDVLDREEIERASLGAGSLADILTSGRLPNLRAYTTQFFLSDRRRDQTRLGLCIELSRERGPGCNLPEVYLNDVRVPRPQFDLLGLDLGAIERIEAIPALEAGARYLNASNGVLLIYTK